MAGCSGAGALVDNAYSSIIGNKADHDRLTGFIGGVVADEPRAALAGREVLANGGNAADAVTAIGFTLAVTYPSRAGLGAGGACLIYRPQTESGAKDLADAVVFTSPAVANDPGADRPAAVPMLARGLFTLHARYGAAAFDSLITPAEQLARFGVLTSRAFARDLALVAGPLLADPGARSAFAGPDGKVLREGSNMLQPDLGASLGQLRTSGVGDLYQGALAHRLAEASRIVGGGLQEAALRAALPRVTPAIVLPNGSDRVAYLPPPADGGIATAAAFQALQRTPGDIAGAQARALAVAAAWRHGAQNVDTLLAGALPPGNLPNLPASTSFMALDRDGMAVICTTSMNNLFGTGRIAPGTGILLAAAPGSTPAPLLAAAIDYNPSLHAFRAAVGASGQDAAALAAAVALSNTLRAGVPMPARVPDPGRANVIACAEYMPGKAESCGWAPDPRGAGLATGAN